MVLEFRLNAYTAFISNRPIPTLGRDWSGLKIDEINYYSRPKQIDQKSSDDVHEKIKNTLTALAYRSGTNTWQASWHSTTLKWSTTISMKTWKNRALSS